MVKLNWSIFESRLRIFETKKKWVAIEILVEICILGTSFNCIFFKVRKQWISTSIPEVIKALVKIMFTIIFSDTLCLIELTIWEYCEDGENMAWVRLLWQWAVHCLLCTCKCSLEAVREKDSPRECLRPAHTESQQRRKSEEEFHSGTQQEKSKDCEDWCRFRLVKAFKKILLYGESGKLRVWPVFEYLFLYHQTT